MAGQAKTNETGIKVIPPLVFAVAMVVAFAIEWLVPVPLVPWSVALPLGLGLIVVSIAIEVAALMNFRRHKTTIDVRHAASVLMTDGLYRFSRNPAYLAMILLCAGIGVLADNMWVAPAVALAVIYLLFNVILSEERFLEGKFGEDYRLYKARVRRWI